MKGSHEHQHQHMHPHNHGSPGLLIVTNTPISILTNMVTLPI